MILDGHQFVFFCSKVFFFFVARNDIERDERTRLLCTNALILYEHM